ncbi:hypothetical protein CB0940_03659 [Cercospora beticola]|uniref:RlpA-like protein double-psi beta-barrel domain-containing protein n=1 Tax=Cercospora beticola TaxID=122368 RepID=A0A2G5I2Q4_CERBT|nr:hypothetical protein CB0940_03659 [Cercospora beticola]PIA99079.1 hypothetical protein CB0940_03659 [Cercospora beticola]WPB00839.1 hypothetical protein RHO25_005459 [Cercospora beticola]CAK1360920.1 unnamed protein product [Cercospora beticola]
MNLIHLFALLGVAAAAPTTLHTTSLVRRGASHEGDMTWKEGDFSGNACGIPPILPAVALNAPTFDASTPGGNPNANTLCGQKIRIWNLATGAETHATVVDRMTAQDAGAIDVSQEVFGALGIDSGKGRCRVGWSL